MLAPETTVHRTGSIYEDLRRVSSEDELVALVYRYFNEARLAKYRIAGRGHDYWDRLEDLCKPFGIEGGGSMQGYGTQAYGRRRSRENYIFQLKEALVAGVSLE